jgi:hypothetical protein
MSKLTEEHCKDLHKVYHANWLLQIVQEVTISINRPLKVASV